MISTLVILSFQVLPFLALLYFFFLKGKLNYWSKQGVAGPPASLLQLGNLIEYETSETTPLELKWVQKYGKVYGIYFGTEAILTVTDPELIKQILVKDFHLFVNRRDLNTMHELVNNGQFFAQDSSWKRIRTITGPTFTSSRLKKMLPLMNKCVEQLTEYLNGQIQENGGVIQTKEVSTSFALSLISSTVFATETNAIGSHGKGSAVITNCMNLFDSPIFRVISFLIFPRWLNNLTGIRYPFNPQSFEYLSSMVREIIRQRRQIGAANGNRNDFVQLLMDVFVDESELTDSGFEKLTAQIDTDDKPKSDQSDNVSNKATLTENEIIAQCLVFFVAGFETTSATITHCLFELAKNQQIQQKLKEEVQNTLADLDSNSDLYYAAIMNNMPYLDAVICETLRMHSPLKRIERKLTGADEYRIGGAVLKRGMMINIPSLALHHSESYFPNPDQFNPERFMPENKHLLVPFTYLPFGAGPRNCVGLRFATHEIKLCIAKLISQFNFQTTSKTPDKLEFKNFKPTLNVKEFELKVIVW